MRLSVAFTVAAILAPVYSLPIKRAIDPALVPDFGHAAGVNPTGGRKCRYNATAPLLTSWLVSGTGDCDGAVNDASGKPIKVPCACPPDRNSFIQVRALCIAAFPTIHLTSRDSQALDANVAAGKAVNNPSVKVTFPTDNSKESQITRINAALVTLQNLNGPGKGCPASSTTLLAQQKAIADGTAPPAPPPAPPAPAPAPPATAPAPTASAGGVDPALVPDLGFQSGLNPTGISLVRTCDVLILIPRIIRNR